LINCTSPFIFADIAELDVPKSKPKIADMNKYTPSYVIEN
jgi:hypothetical protein